MSKDSTVIRGTSYIVRPMTINDLVTMAPNLPTAQRVRGSVWKPEVSKELLVDIKAGKYVPPLVLAGDEKEHDLSDGQQRLTAILRDRESEKPVLDGTETVLLVVDAGRTFAESFRKLNLGVPVGAGLVTAMTYRDDVGAAVLQLAAHPLFDLYRWTSTQMNRTARADFASVALAICAGWESPESAQKACGEWLKNNPDCIDADTVATTKTALDLLHEALIPYDKAQGDTLHKKEAKAAKSILAAFRKKNLFMTAVAAISTGTPAEDVAACITRDDLLNVVVEYEVIQRNSKGKETTKKCKAIWETTVGGGSSGSNAEYLDRLRIVRNAAGLVKQFPTADAETAQAGKVQDVENDADKLLGLVAGGGAQ